MSRPSKHNGRLYGVGNEPGPLADHNLITWTKIRRAVDYMPQPYEVLCDVAAAHKPGGDVTVTNGAGFVRYCIRRGWLAEYSAVG